MPYFGVACPEPPQYPPWQFHSRQTWLSKEGVPKLLGFKNPLHSLNLLKTPKRFCLCVLYLWLFVALEDKTENLNIKTSPSSCQSNDAFTYGVSGKLHCVLIKEWEWEKQIEPYYEGNNFDLMDLFPVSRAARSPQTVLFFPKKNGWCIYYLCIFVFWLWWVFTVAVRRGYSSLSWAQAPHYSGFSYCRAQALHCSGFSSSNARPQKLWLTGLFATWHVGSFQTRDRTRVSPALQGELLTTGTPGKPMNYTFRITHLRLQFSKRTDAARIFWINILDVEK